MLDGVEYDLKRVKAKLVVKRGRKVTGLAGQDGWAVTLCHLIEF